MRYLWFGVAAPSYTVSTWWPQGESVDHSHLTWGSMNAPYKSISVETNIKLKGSALHRSGEKRSSMAFLLLGYGTLFTILYLSVPNPVIHQVCQLKDWSLSFLGFPISGDVWAARVLYDFSSRDDTQRKLQRCQHEVRIAKLYCFGLLLYASQALLLGNIHVWIWVPVMEFGWAQNISILCQTGPSENSFCPHVERVRSNLPPILAPLTQLHGWWHLFAGRSILLPSRAFFFQCYITVTGPITSPFQPHHNSIAGYATYMNIQFCLFHRLSYLKLSPRYTSDLMGVAVQVWRIEARR